MTERADWHKDAIFYGVPIKSFYDSNGDGIGDLNGLTQKLDYLQQLGIDCIWLLPMYPSPLRDDGYDISDFYSIHPDYGTVEDFERLVKSAHERNIRVVADLVLNHSDQHPWFSRHGSQDPKRDWYVWSRTTKSKARESSSRTLKSNWTWDGGANTVAPFLPSHQPDLNYDNPEVRAGC